MKISFKALFKATLILGVLAVSALLLFSFLSSFLPLADSVAHFRLYLMGALAAVLSFCLIMHLRKTAFSGALVLLAGFASIFPVLYNWDGLWAKGNETDLTVMQFNLLYNNSTPETVLPFIKKHNPDVIALQELSKSNKVVLDALVKDYPYSVICFDSGVRSSVVLSKFQPVSENGQSCEKYPDLVDGVQVPGVPRMTVTIKDKVVSIVSLHLLWPYPYNQQLHITQINKTLARLPGSLVIAGDFNAAPWSHAVDQIEQASKTRIIGGIRHSWSYRIPSPIMLPIDHILISENMIAHSVEKGPHVGSDHRPIIAKLRFK